MTRRAVAVRLLRRLRPLAPMMAVSATARVVNQGLAVAIPAIAGAMLAHIALGSPIGGLVAVLVGLALVKGTFRYVEQFTGHAVAFRLLADLRVDTYRSIVPLAPAGVDADRTGDLVSRVIGDIDRVEPFYAHTIAPLVSGISVPLLAAAGLAIWVDPWVALAFLPFPLLMVAAVPFVRAGTVESLTSEEREAAGTTASLFVDSIQGVREIEVFDAREAVTERICRAEDRGASARDRLAGIRAVRAGLGDLLAGGAVLAVATVAASRVDVGAVDAAGLAAAVVVAWAGTASARVLEDIVPDLEEALSAARRIFELADRPDPVPAPATGGPVPVDESVGLDGVGLTFAGARDPALRDVTIAVPSDGYTAIVGPSGSGKSTIAALVLRLRDPSVGTVRVGRVDVRSIPPSVLAAHVALVPQRPDIFYGTIRSNVLLGRPTASDDDVWRSLERAALGVWVRSRPEGLDTVVGELGETMSGGQRQRLAIARAFVADAPILVLDEATSELDPVTEEHVLREIAHERATRTVIVIAHRLDTITDADDIVVVDAGTVVETGRHADLLARHGVYAGLWRRHRDVLADT